MMNFSDLQLSSELCATLSDMNYSEPSEIQRTIIPLLLNDQNVQVSAHYGNGKTAAFLLPIIQKLSAHDNQGPRALIIVPSANYAHKVKTNLSLLSKNLDLNYVNLNDHREHDSNLELISLGIDIVIGTPNAIYELIQSEKLNLEHVSELVIDESDLYNELNYIADLEELQSYLPKNVCVAMFHGEEDQFISQISKLFMDSAKKLVFYEDDSNVQEIAYITEGIRNKIDSLKLHLQQSRYRNVIVFANSYKIAEEIFFKLKKIYNHKVAFLNKRRIEIKDKLLRLFYDGKVQILIVCADDFEKPFQLHGIHQVINFDISQNPDEHNQRKSLLRGFNKNSMMVSFCDEADKSRLDEIEKEFDTSIERFYYNDIGVKESYSAKTDSSEFGFGRYAKDRHRY